MGNQCEICVENVTKVFGSQEVLKTVCVKFEMGKIYGIVGRNGSGKTVLLKCICGLLYPQTGTVTVSGRVVGKDVDYPQNIGFIIETPGFLPGYPGLKNLKYLASVRGKVKEDEIRKYMELVGLNPENPDILILDEPMNALDNNGVEEMRSVLLKMKEQGKLIIIASHVRDDIEILCDEVYGMDAGIMKKIR